MSQGQMPATSTPLEDVKQRALIRTMVQRRRRVWLNIAAILVIMALMVVLSMAVRDDQAVRGTVRDCRAALEVAGERLQVALDRGIFPPPTLPLPREELPASADRAAREAADERHLDRLLRYEYDPQHRRRASGGPVRVAYDLEPHGLYLQEDQRHVLLFDGTRYTVATLSEAEFQRRWPE